MEFPAVAKGAARFRMQVMANHTDANIAHAVERLRSAKEEATLELERFTEPQLKAIA